MPLLRYVAINAIVILATAVVVPMIAFAPRSGEQVAVVFTPWTDAEAASERVWRAGGSILSQNGSAVVAISDSDTFFTRLRQSGAVLILDAERVAALCGVSPG